MTEVEIILIRHGEAASSWGDDPDPGLSNLGKSQSEAVRENLESIKSQNFQLISSPKKRAIETAQPTSLDWKSEIKIDDAFSEIPASNIKLESRMKWLKSMMNMDIHSEFQPPGINFTMFVNFFREELLMGKNAMALPLIPNAVLKV